MIKIFHAEENAEPVELGMADKVRFRWETTGQPLAQGGIYELRESHAPQGLRVYGWKNSTPYPGMMFPIVKPSSQETMELHLVISALVHMLGGAVVISPSELTSASRLELVAQRQMDPDLFIINTKEK